jgi:homocysteine S-methyltransferase
MHHEIRAAGDHEPVFVAGVIGPSGDAYTPAEALDADEAAAYHRPQAQALAECGCDLLFAPTFPAVDEAIGACRAMAETGLPYVISYVLGTEGAVLDATPLARAIDRVDEALEAPPLIHSLSCVHPSVAARAVAKLRADSPTALARLGELKANGSPLPTSELVELNHPEADAPDLFAQEMWELFDPDGLRVLGGCCGTTDEHMRALAKLMRA